MFSGYIIASLFAVSPARNSEQWVGCVMPLSAWLAKSTIHFMPFFLTVGGLYQLIGHNA
jgi:hypothetical protein